MKIATAPTNQNSLMRKSMVLVMGFLAFHHFASAQTAQVPAPEPQSYFSNTLFLALLAIIALLLLVIKVMAQVVNAAAKNKIDEEKRKKSNATGLGILLALISLSAFSGSLFAQTATAVVPAAEDPSYMGLDPYAFWVMSSIILLELVVVLKLYSVTMELLGVAERKRRIAEENAKLGIKEVSLLDKMNASVTIEHEADVMMDHDYDGIKELDNDLPPWWKYGFYLTIIWAFLYLINFHVTKTGKLQLAEYEEQMAQAKHDLEEYKKKASNLVDENTVTLDQSAEVLAAGKNTFLDNCAACHGKNAEGGVGPNLTDDYWLHGGSIKNIFKTIKFGWPEKGMKSWEQDLGAKQIFEVANYVKSLKGSNPANPKDKQGDFYTEEGAAPAGDSTAVASDSLKVIADSVKVNQNK